MVGKSRTIRFIREVIYENLVYFSSLYVKNLRSNRRQIYIYIKKIESEKTHRHDLLQTDLNPQFPDIR